MAEQTLMPLMHPVTLEFAIDGIESQFREEFAKGRYELDIRSSTAGFVAHIIFTIAAVGLGQDLVLSLYSLERLTLILSLWYFSKQYIPWGRTITLIVHRFLADLIIAPRFIRWMGYSSSIMPLAIVRHLVISSGALCLWYLTAELVLPLKYTLLLQAVSTIIYSYFMTSDCCSMLLDSNLGSAMVSTTWQQIHKLLNLTSFVGRLQILDPEALTEIGSRPQLSCYCVVMLTQVAAGYLLPVLVLYNMERRERIHFWAGKFRHCVWEVQAEARISMVSKLLVAVMLGLVCLCVWEAAVVQVFNHMLP